MKGVLACTEDGQLTYCYAKPENVGKGRCKHLMHKKENESEDDFVKRLERNNFKIPYLQKIKEARKQKEENRFRIDFNNINTGDYLEDEVACKFKSYCTTHQYSFEKSSIYRDMLEGTDFILDDEIRLDITMNSKKTGKMKPVGSEKFADTVINFHIRYGNSYTDFEEPVIVLEFEVENKKRNIDAKLDNLEYYDEIVNILDKIYEIYDNI